MPREDEARRLVASRKKSPDSIERCEVVRLWLHVQRTSTTSHLSSGFALGDLSVSCLSQMYLIDFILSAVEFSLHL